MQNIFQSQEVTYADLTFPRNKGYTPLRRTPTHAISPSAAAPGEPIVYARIDHNCAPQSGGKTLAPLIITGSTSACGGLSPSSLMNTSVDSSTSGTSGSVATTARCRSDSPRDGARSSTDEGISKMTLFELRKTKFLIIFLYPGFTSGSSPLGLIPTSSHSGVLSPNSATVQLVNSQPVSSCSASCSSSNSNEDSILSPGESRSSFVSKRNNISALARESTV